jgi:predicted ferric reductase
MTVLASTTAYWYLTRSTGAVAMLLLSATVALGVVDLRRFASATWPRFVVDELHRNLSLLALAFLVIHILTSVLDSFAPISLTASVIPFVSSYRPFWLGLGAVSFDLILAVIVTRLARRRVGYRGWRAVHWLSYAAWPIALLHGLGTGSDVKSGWLQILSVVCALAVLVAVLVRIGASRELSTRARGAALAGTGAFALFLVIWLPGGPLGSEWARRSGTPSALLPKGHARGAHQ